MKAPKQKINYRLIVSCLILFVALALIVHKGVMTPWEGHFFWKIYNWPSSLTPLMLIITESGSSWMMAIIATFLLYIKQRSLACQVIVVAMSTYLVVEIAKRLVDRLRPFDLLPNLVVAREPLVTGLGFPSGHTAVTTAVGLLLYKFAPKPQRYLLLVWIGLVGLSRIYLGVHAPLDVLGGFALGVIIMQLFELAWPKFSSWSKHLK